MAETKKYKTVRKETPKKVYAERAETKAPDMDKEDIRAAALAYARYLRENGLEPGDATFVEPESLGVNIEESKRRQAQAEAQAKAKAEAQARAKAEAQAKAKAAAQAKAKAEAQAKAKAAAQAKAKAEAQAKAKAEAQARAKAEAKARARAEAQAMAKAAAQAKAKAEARTRSKAEAQARAKAAAQARMQAEQEAEIEARLTMLHIDSAEELKKMEPAPVKKKAPSKKNETSAVKKADAEAERKKKASQAKKQEQAKKKEQAKKQEQAKKKEKAQAKENKEREKAQKEKEKRLRAEKRAAEKREAKKHAPKKKPQKSKAFRPVQKSSPLAAIVEFHDNLQDRIDKVVSSIGMDFAKGTHQIASSYRLSRRSIGMAILVITLLASALLIIFDRFTVYEYAYNGKVLGYVSDQEEVTDILDVAGEKLSQNLNSETGVKFVANQNITFNEVDSRGKSTDDADTAVNKLIYLTDIETEAFGIYDGDRIVAIVKDSKEAETLLNETKDELSRPDSGMTLVSSEFINPLDIKPINVLLSSVQSSAAAREQMVKGGEMETFHIVEEGETLEGLADEFGVEDINIYDENNSEPVTEVEQGDKVCIRSTVDPVNVKMVESGKMKETIEYKTIKKESDEYYKGDSFVEQKGKNGVQIFEGSITKVAGEVTDRKEDSIEIIEEKKDKIILVGTKERPKTAPTGTFAMPIQSYVITSEFGGRWGRMHEGMDFGAGTGTPIYAADGGKVVRAGWYSGYGLCVEIDHEHGKLTRYGHCSRLLVSPGDMVYQGQEIAKVGNTGHSFGSHLHFEVRINGSPQNPRNYINP